MTFDGIAQSAAFFIFADALAFCNTFDAAFAALKEVTFLGKSLRDKDPSVDLFLADLSETFDAEDSVLFTVFISLVTTLNILSYN
ncbi:MAG TPA: hypothetical protein PLE16_04260 [Spirochaetota bacterium]|nr:hypothetical protein [Spirochaetota bacterium]HOH37744.1 hypothetical protein [Spirochaetota bacterium]HPJ15147.1 hypothetical protein [Spirochaetota bacterium]HPM33796.1 hypothetical protein [Spirochaetota bacterium]HPY04107.1 hypothetical protein [Spirochaetota bacterium]